MSIEENIKELNITLPEPKAPVGSYVAAKKSGNFLFISGQISTDNKGQLIKGKIGSELNVEQGYEAAMRCGLSLLSQAKKACNGDLSQLKSCIKITGYVNSTNDFVDQPKVINGASEIITKILGEKGFHARAAVSVNSLPLGVAVEVDAIFEIK